MPKHKQESMWRERRISQENKTTSMKYDKLLWTSSVPVLLSTILRWRNIAKAKLQVSRFKLCGYLEKIEKLKFEGSTNIWWIFWNVAWSEHFLKDRPLANLSFLLFQHFFSLKTTPQRSVFFFFQKQTSTVNNTQINIVHFLWEENLMTLGQKVRYLCQKK